jgi:hypothetical protein
MPCRFTFYMYIYMYFYVQLLYIYKPAYSYITTRSNVSKGTYARCENGYVLLLGGGSSDTGVDTDLLNGCSSNGTLPATHILSQWIEDIQAQREEDANARSIPTHWVHIAIPPGGTVVPNMLIGGLCLCTYVRTGRIVNQGINRWIRRHHCCVFSF